MSPNSSPHHPAAFINAIAEEGSKEEAIRYLQKTWNELCEAREEIKELSKRVRGLEMQLWNL